MKYAYTILYVENVQKTLDFYKAAFGFKIKFITPQNDYGELISGETVIAFAQHKLASSNLKSGYLRSDLGEKPFGAELGFTSQTIEKDFQQAIDAGATVVEALVTKPWGQQVGYVRDLNGFLIEICTPIQN
jgi:uncharacterized glyoxalase superfamily protein PhnB